MSRERIEPSDHRSKRIKVGVTVDDEAWLKARAKEAGMDMSGYLYALLQAARGEGELPRRRTSCLSDDAVHALNALLVAVTRLGTNVNQLARQANAGLVPLSRSDAEEALNAVQVILAQAKGCLERLFA